MADSHSSIVSVGPGCPSMYCPGSRPAAAMASRISACSGVYCCASACEIQPRVRQELPEEQNRSPEQRVKKVFFHGVQGFNKG